MIPVPQTRSGRLGDCFPACLASLLELPLADVPDFMAGLPAWEEDADAKVAWLSAFLSAVNAWLRPRGLCYFEFWGGEAIGDALVEMVSQAGYWIAVGETARGEAGAMHAVVMRGAELAHDPGPAGTGLARIRAVGLLVALDPAKGSTP